MVDSRGVSTEEPFYPHTLNCFRKGMNMTNPQPCDCGGNEMMAAQRKGK